MSNISDEITKEEIGAIIEMYMKLPKQDRLLISNSTYTLFLREEMNWQRESVIG